MPSKGSGISPFMEFSPAKACLHPAGRCALLGAGRFPPGVSHAMGKELITLVLCSAWSTAAGSSRPAQLQTLQLLLTCCTTWPSAPEVNTHLDTIVILRHCTLLHYSCRRFSSSFVWCRALKTEGLSCHLQGGGLQTWLPGSRHPRCLLLSCRRCCQPKALRACWMRRTSSAWVRLLSCCP